MKISAILLTVFSVVIFVFTNANSSNLRGKPNVKDEVLDCNDYDPKLIKLVTFDVFAALMDLNSKYFSNEIY